MSNQLSIEYYRLVTEGMDTAWAQVYVKTPLDELELKQKGGVFAALRVVRKTEGVTGEEEIEVLRKVEEWCSDVSRKGDVSGLLKMLADEGVEGIIAWVVVDDAGVRKIKVGGVGGVMMSLVRNKQMFKLVTKGNGQVMVGELKAGDVVVLGDNLLMELLEEQELVKTKDWGEFARKTQVKAEETGRIMAGLMLIVNEMVTEEEMESEELLIPTTKPEKVKAEEELVTDRVVGVKDWRSRWREMQLSWSSVLKRREEPKILTQSAQKRHRLVLLAGGIFLVVLMVSVGVGLIKARANQKQAQINAFFEPLEKKRQEAEEMFSLNPTGARELLRSVRSELETKTVEGESKEWLARRERFGQELEVTWEKVAGEQKVALELFFNLELLRDRLEGNRLAVGADGLVLDGNLGVVSRIGLEDKKAEVILGRGEGLDWRDVAGVNRNVVVLGGAGLVGFLGEKQTEAAYDGSVKDPVGISMFGEAAYVLDKGASEIWRYGLTGGVIGERRRWLAAGVESDLTEGVDLAIDTDIWILLSDGELKRFRRGNEERFALTDLPEDFKPTRVAVGEEGDTIALLDAAFSRVVLFRKTDGGFIKQLIADELTKARDLVFVDEKTLMVLVDGQLFKLAI